MKEPTDLLSINALFDIRVETLATTLLAKSEMSEHKFELDQVVVAPQGHGRRRSEYEVKAIKRKYYDHDTVLYVEVNRKGLYDTLPDGLFLDLDEEFENAIAKTKAIERQIKEARKFFLPFEQSIYLSRIEIDVLEQKWTEFFPDFIKEIWGLQEFGDCLDERQRFLLCYILPEAYRVVGNWELTGLCFEAVLQKPVDLRFMAPLEFEIPDSNVPASEQQLGENTIIGDHFMDDMPALEVSIKGITLSELSGYLPGGSNLRVLEELLYSYLLPLDVAVVTKVIVTDDAFDATLGEAVLGYNIKFN